MNSRQLALLKSVAATPGHSVATFAEWREMISNGTDREFWTEVFIAEATGLLVVDKWILTERGMTEIANDAKRNIVLAGMEAK